MLYISVPSEVEGILYNSQTFIKRQNMDFLFGSAYDLHSELSHFM